MKTIKKIDILSVAKIFGVICGVIYLVVGIVLNLAYFVYSLTALKNFNILDFGSSLLASMLTVVLAGAVAFLLGAILAWLYNTAAGFIGGIVWEEVDYVKPLKKEADSMPAMTFTAPENKEQEPPRETF